MTAAMARLMLLPGGVPNALCAITAEMAVKGIT